MAAPISRDNSAPPTNLLVKNLSECAYTAFFCEENIWKLCEHVQLSSPEDVPNCWVVFISNDERAVPLWNQKASKSPEQPVIWDYHVLLLYQKRGQTWVYDLDTRLPFPCPFQHYAEKTIHSEEILKPEYHRWFRVVSSLQYLRHFASDRTHMLSEDGQWQKVPPPYPCIQTPESRNNIEDFISMGPARGWGEVLSYQQFISRFLPS